MSAVSLPRSVVLASLFHLTLFGVALVIMRQSNHFVMPSAYTVSLAGPEEVTRATGEPPATQKAPKEERIVNRAVSNPQGPRAPSGTDERLLEDRIHALKEMGKIRTLARLRGIISLKAGKGDTKMDSSTEVTTQQRGSLTEDYAARVGEAIHRQWQFPSDLLKDRNIDSIVSVRILKNGVLQIIGIEKSSGNPLFDRSALRAITQASPVTPPPYEMEIGVRFFPGD